MVSSDRNFVCKVEKDFNGLTVFHILKQKFNFSSRLISKLKNENGLHLNDLPIRTIDNVKENDILKITIKGKKSETIKPVKMNLDIIYEDEDILIVNKQSNLPVHPSIGNISNTLANGVVFHYEEIGEQHLFHPVHRLDMNTTGIMIIAKNKYVNERLSFQIENNILKRTYIAILDGKVELEKGTIDLPIDRIDAESFKRCVSQDGKRAITHFEVLKQAKENTLIKIILETGRTHQIRVHFSHLGFPLAGDSLYGGSEKLIRPALHSSSLSFIHPITKKNMEFYCEIPKDMEKIIANFY